MQAYPTFDYELELWKKDYIVIGVDEVGRGAIAGPIVASALAFAPYVNVKGKRNKVKVKNYSNYQLPITNYQKRIIIDDSKRLTEKQRKITRDWLINNCLGYYQASISVDYINKYGISKANRKVMRDAVAGLINKLKTDKKLFILSDFLPIRHVKTISTNQQINLIHGDQISCSIAAASIIAKVSRDMYMCQISSQFPKYFWHQNKGYGTKYHISAIKQYGINDHHRKQFISKYIK